MIELLGKQTQGQHASLNDFPALSKDEVHLWWLPLSLSQAQSNLALSWLSDIQRDKYHRRSTEELKHAYLAGRFYLLQLLAGYSNGEPHAVELSYSRLNKPSLSNADLDIQFNFTDTGAEQNHYGVFAFSHSRPVGVDIENLSRNIDFKTIVDKRFSPQEQSYVYDGDELNREKCLAIWTRKEAYGKAIGKGINFKMNQRNLVNSTGEQAHQITFEDEQKTHWRCLQLKLGNQFIASLVHQGAEELPIKTFIALEA